jgi:periplasmic divalent cation tolerance protein
MTDIIQLSTTTESEADAQRIAETLVEQRLAACVQIHGPILSRYWWNGKVEQASEWLCTVKTTREAYERAEVVIRDLHPYDVPEILAVPVIDGSADYLQWVRQQVSDLEA